jgi:hypothetical protein
MKYLFLFFCLILCSCEDSRGDWDCIPIGSGKGFIFNSSGGIDSIYIDNSWWSFTGVREEEGCEVKPEAMECSWFSLVKRENIVFATVKQNNTGEGRYADVRIKGNGGSGECSDVRGMFEIYQCPELTDMELSKDELLFSSEGGMDSVIVTTGRNHWLNYPDINVSYDGVVYVFDPNTDGFNFSDYVSKYSYIKDPWFNINTVDEKLIFSINRNESGKERNFSVSFPGSCKPSVKIIQSAE